MFKWGGLHTLQPIPIPHHYVLSKWDRVNGLKTSASGLRKYVNKFLTKKMDYRAQIDAFSLNIFKTMSANSATLTTTDNLDYSPAIIEQIGSGHILQDLYYRACRTMNCYPTWIFVTAIKGWCKSSIRPLPRSLLHSYLLPIAPALPLHQKAVGWWWKSSIPNLVSVIPSVH